MLDDIKHAELIKGMDRYCQQAQIPKAFLYQSATTLCDKPDIEFIRRFPKIKKSGFAGYVKIGGEQSTRKLMLMAAALLRNYTDARVYSLESALEMDYQCSALFIPDFCVGMTDKKATPSWKVSQISELLISRFNAEKPTILFVQDINTVKTVYGDFLLDFLTSNYITSEKVK